MMSTKTTGFIALVCALGTAGMAVATTIVNGDLKVSDGGKIVFPDSTSQSTAQVQGPAGPTGPSGPANTLGIGTVLTGGPGTAASANITGTAPNQTLNLLIPQGPQGVKGDSGAPGANGSDGKTIWSGTSDPSAATGANGDFYINTANNKLFGPKASGAWPAGISLVGPQGPAGASYSPPRAPVLATGQVKSYAVGDDGFWMAGASLPASQRFYDNGDGTVKDNLTGLIWLKNANCTDTVGGIDKSGGSLTWADALTWSNNLASGACSLSDGSTAGKWRLPNRTELMSLVDHSNGYPALPAGHPFTNVQSSSYWSGSTFPGQSPASAWNVDMATGIVYYLVETDFYYVWPVRAGQ